MTRVYLDNAASTPLDPAVRDAMVAAMALIGNPSAIHEDGRVSRKAIDDARSAIADLLRVREADVMFTSGATEANVTAILGHLQAVRDAGHMGRLHILTTPLEHSSVAAALRAATVRFGAEVELLPVDTQGRVGSDSVARMIRPDTALVCMMWASNLFGTVQPVTEAGAAVAAERARRKDGSPIAFLVDAVQALGTTDISPDTVHADLLSISSHKINGPKGVGALYVREGTPFAPQIVGGRQERNRRGGTENLVGIVGFGEAARILAERREEDAAHAVALTERLEKGLAGFRVPARIVGDGADRVPHIRYALLAQEGDLAVVSLDVAGISVSSGSACDTGSRRTADALAAVCTGQDAARGGVRFSVGRFTSEEDIDRVIGALQKLPSR